MLNRQLNVSYCVQDFAIILMDLTLMHMRLAKTVGPKDSQDGTTFQCKMKVKVFSKAKAAIISSGVKPNKRLSERISYQLGMRS